MALVSQTLTQWAKLLCQGLSNEQISPVYVELADQLVQGLKTFRLGHVSRGEPYGLSVGQQIRLLIKDCQIYLSKESSSLVPLWMTLSKHLFSAIWQKQRPVAQAGTIFICANVFFFAPRALRTRAPTLLMVPLVSLSAPGHTSLMSPRLALHGMKACFHMFPGCGVIFFGSQTCGFLCLPTIKFAE